MKKRRIKLSVKKKMNNLLNNTVPSGMMGISLLDILSLIFVVRNLILICILCRRLSAFFVRYHIVTILSLAAVYGIAFMMFEECEIGPRMKDTLFCNSVSASVVL